MTWGTAYVSLAEHIRERFRRHRHHDLGRVWQLLLGATRSASLRIAPVLHDLSFQGFGTALLRVCFATQGSPNAPARPFLLRALDAVGNSKKVDKERVASRERQSPPFPDGSLEKVLCDCRDDFAPGDQARLRLVIIGGTKPLDPRVREQMYVIAREALVNALQHSGARWVEAEVEYLRRKLRVVIRDDGKGIDPKVLRQNPHRGLTAMRDNVASLGGNIRVWSKPGKGTEVEISVPLARR
jgi:hypothetical protein